MGTRIWPKPPMANRLPSGTYFRTAWPRLRLFASCRDLFSAPPAVFMRVAPADELAAKFNRIVHGLGQFSYSVRLK